MPTAAVTRAAWSFPPKQICPECWSESIDVVEVAGGGRLVSFSLPRRPNEDSDPLITAVVAMDQADGVRILTSLVGSNPDEVAIGMAVALDWVPQGETYVPVVRASGDRS